MTQSDWPFEDAPNTGVFVTRHVMEGEPICFVYKGWGDSAWQFLPNRPILPRDAMLVCLREVYERDRSIAELKNLPPGWMAERDAISGHWRRKKDHPYPVFADHGYYLDDATEYERLYPEKYSIPSTEIRENLKVGDVVKLIFRFAGEWTMRLDNQCERMWVEVKEVDADYLRYRGELLNEPALHSAIVCGDELWFHSIHVFDTHRE
jgi:hypothetical protein